MENRVCSRIIFYGLSIYLKWKFKENIFRFTSSDPLSLFFNLSIVVFSLIILTFLNHRTKISRSASVDTVKNIGCNVQNCRIYCYFWSLLFAIYSSSFFLNNQLRRYPETTLSGLCHQRDTSTVSLRSSYRQTITRRCSYRKVLIFRFGRYNFITHPFMGKGIKLTVIAVRWFDILYKIKVEVVKFWIFSFNWNDCIHYIPCCLSFKQEF